MKQYAVQIKETLSMTVTVDAKNATEAREMVENGWKDGDYILDAECFTGATFSVQTRADRER